MGLTQPMSTLLGGVGGGLISGLLQLGGNRLQYKYNKNLQMQQFQNELGLSKVAHFNTLDQQLNAADLQQRNWNNQFAAENQRQNDLLLNQKRMEVEAMKRAGLNPALAGGAVASTQVANPSASTPSASASMGSAASASVGDPNLGDAFAKGMQSSTNLMQAPYANENLKANTTLALAKAKTEDASRDPMIKKLIQETAESQSREDLNRENIKRIQTLTPLEANEILARTELSKAEKNAIERKLPEELKVLAAQATELAARTLEETRHGELYEEQKRTEKTQQSFNVAAAANQKAQAGYYFEQANYINKSLELLAAEICKTKAEQAELVTRSLKELAETNNLNLEAVILRYTNKVKTNFSPKYQAWKNEILEYWEKLTAGLRDLGIGFGSVSKGMQGGTAIPVKGFGK